MTINIECKYIPQMSMWHNVLAKNRSENHLLIFYILSCKLMQSFFKCVKNNIREILSLIGPILIATEHIQICKNVVFSKVTCRVQIRFAIGYF